MQICGSATTGEHYRFDRLEVPGSHETFTRSRGKGRTHGALAFKQQQCDVICVGVLLRAKVSCGLRESAAACKGKLISCGMGWLKRCLVQVPSGLLPALEVDGQLWTESADIMSLLEVRLACVPLQDRASLSTGSGVCRSAFWLCF